MSKEKQEAFDALAVEAQRLDDLLTPEEIERYRWEIWREQSLPHRVVITILCSA